MDVTVTKRKFKSLRNSGRDGLSGLAVFHAQKDITQPEPPPPQLPTADEGVQPLS